jgi:hypothetical protein
MGGVANSTQLRIIEVNPPTSLTARPPPFSKEAFKRFNLL